MSTLRVGGVRFRIHPQDHEPVHVHARYAETSVIIELLADGAIRIADREDAILPPNAKRSDVKKILSTACECYYEIIAIWERMQGES